ncbi:MAG: T9SS type A sorting domain-containing protein [Bacteroidota bacterium]
MLICWLPSTDLFGQSTYARKFNTGPSDSASFPHQVLILPDSSLLLQWDDGSPVSADSQWIGFSHHLPDGSLLNTTRIRVIQDSALSSPAYVTLNRYGHLLLSLNQRTPDYDSGRIQLMRVDPSTFTPIWNRTYAQDSTEIFQTGLLALNNGNLLLYGGAYDAQPNVNFYYHSYLIVVDSAGDPVWEKQIAQSFFSLQNAMEAPNGDLYLLGSGVSPNNGDEIVQFLRLDSLGNTLASSYHNLSPYFFEPKHMVMTSSSELAAVGELRQGNPIFNGAFLKFDTAGTFVSGHSFDGQTGMRDAISTNTRIVVTGYTRDIGPDPAHLYIAGIDFNGNLEWMRYYDEPFAVDSATIGSGQGLAQTPDGGFVFVGYAGQNYEWKGMLMRSDSLGMGICNMIDSLPLTIPLNPTTVSLSAPDTTVALVTGAEPFSVQTFPLTDSFVCEVPCVWPGDTDNDGIAHNVDLLNIGLAYGQTGSPRTAPTNEWACHTASTWSSSFSSGLNHKFADCNGDGQVDADDTLAIYLNYNFTHNKTHTPAATSTTPDLVLVFGQDSAFVGDTVYAAVLLGNANIPADSIYGLAFTLLYDNALVDSGSAWIRFDSSFFGDSSNTLTLSRDFWTLGAIDGALVRTDQFDASGYGQIATLGFILIDNIEGKRQAAAMLHAGWSVVSAVLAGGGSAEVAVAGDSLVVLDPEIGQPEVTTDLRGLQVFPNPAQDMLHVSVARGRLDQVEVVDLRGKVLLKAAPGGQAAPGGPGGWTWHTADFARGVYLLRVQAGGATAYRRVILID